MKKLYVMAMALIMTASAYSETTLKMLSFGGEPGVDEPGMLGLGISPNGKYVCGTLEGSMGWFIGSLDNDKMIYNISDSETGDQLININNEGVAIGYEGEEGVICTLEGKTTRMTVPSGYKYILGEDISEDGSVKVGMMVAPGFQTEAGYCRNDGDWKSLPLPDMDLDYFNTKQVVASHVSADGKLILGYIGFAGPAVLWRLDDKGEYVVDPIFKDYVMMSLEDTEKPWLRFIPCGMSPDGHYVVLKVCTYDEGKTGLMTAAVFDTQTRELKVYDSVQTIDTYSLGLNPTAIANTGTFIGMIGEPNTNVGAFIMFAGQSQAQTFTTAFPEYAKEIETFDLAGYHYPADISADGTRILGNGWYSASEDIHAPESTFYFATYVIETDKGSGVKEVGSSDMNAEPVGYYGLDGIMRSGLQNGLNLVQMSDGSVKKVFVSK